jgi:L-ribulokinase
MQILSDIMNREILVSASDQAVALGAAMFAAVSSGVHESLEEAQDKMGGGYSDTFSPRPAGKGVAG